MGVLYYFKYVKSEIIYVCLLEVFEVSVYIGVFCVDIC